LNDQQTSNRIRAAQLQAAFEFDSAINDSEWFKDPDFSREMEFEEKKSQLNDINSAKLAKKNKVQVIIRNMFNHSLLEKIEPPFFESISFLKFSPSGRLLLVANENSQYFYVYEIMPATGLRVNGAGGPNN
jgi:hypothetical protein